MGLQREQNPNINYVVLFVAVFSPSTPHEISAVFLYCNEYKYSLFTPNMQFFPLFSQQ